MRITFLLPRYGWHPSGGYKVVYEYANRLAERGHEVTVVHPRRLHAGGFPAPLGAGARLRRFARDFLARLTTPSLSWAALRTDVRVLHVPELAPAHVPVSDIIVATWWATAEALLALPPSHGRPCYFIQGAELWFGEEERVRATWGLPICKIVISSWLRDLCIAEGAASDSIEIVHNGVDTNVFRVAAPVAQRGNVVCMHYSPDAHKGGAFGLEVLNRARGTVTDLQVILFGFAPPPNDMQPWMRYYRAVAPSVLASEVYNASALYLCPSFSEGWHLPNTEAMASGCALVTSDIDGVKDYAIDGVTARLYPVGNVEAAASTIVELLGDAAQRMQLIDNGLERASSMAWDRSADRFEAVLKTLKSAT